VYHNHVGNSGLHAYHAHVYDTQNMQFTYTNVEPGAHKRREATPRSIHDSVEQRCNNHSSQVMPIFGSQLCNSCYISYTSVQLLPGLPSLTDFQ